MHTSYRTFGRLLCGPCSWRRAVAVAVAGGSSTPAGASPSARALQPSPCWGGGGEQRRRMIWMIWRRRTIGLDWIRIFIHSWAKSNQIKPNCRPILCLLSSIYRVCMHLGLAHHRLWPLAPSPRRPCHPAQGESRLCRQQHGDYQPVFFFFFLQ